MHTTRWGFWFAPIVLPLLAACGAEVASPGELGPVGAIGTAGHANGGAGGSGGGSLANKAPPTISFTAPMENASLTAAQATFTGVSSSGLGVASVFVAVGPNIPLPATTKDNFQTWSLTSAVPVGSFQAIATAYDVNGQPSSKPAVLDLTYPSNLSDAASPVVTILTPMNGSTPAQTLVLVQGTATDDRGVVKMDVQDNGTLITDRAVETQDFFAHWTRLVPLLPGLDNVLLFTAYDAAGHTGTATITLHGPTVVDTTPPQVAFVSPQNNDSISTDMLSLAGTAFDGAGVSEVKVRVGTTDGSGTVTFGPYSDAMTSTGYSQWAATLNVPPGALTLEARAIDLNGLATSTTETVTNNFVPTFSPEVAYPLTLHLNQPLATINLTLDKTGVNQIIDADLQKTIRLLDLDPTALLANSLNQIKVACGTAWQNDNSDPMHDCSLTPLGQTFMGPDGTWESSPEYSLVRLLTMTPANVVVTGTSIAGLENIADGAILGITIGGGFGQILSDTLGISRTTEIVGTAAAANSLRVEWMATHPALAPDGNIPITLYDAMNDLSPLGAELGPSGTHPGVLDPSFPPHSVVFGDNFEMILEATSHLVWKDGIDLSMGKEYIATLDVPGGDVLTFDFDSPTGFDVEGLTPTPTVDLRLKILEDPTFVSSCNGDDGCQGNLPQSPYMTQYVWSKPSWELEPIVGFAAYNTYNTRTFDHCYISTIGCQTEVEVGQNGTPPGWTHFDILFNLGNPPKDQYLWELISEVGQVALHNYDGMTLPEGQANVAFTLQDVPVGLTADQIKSAVRPFLQDQGPKLSAGLLGDYAKNNGAVDFYYDLGADSLPYLYFVDSTDPLPVSYNYSTPGFFSDEALTMKVSSTADGGSGDSMHEKLKLSSGQTIVFAKDDLGKVYRIRLVVPGEPAPVVTAWVSAKL